MDPREFLRVAECLLHEEAVAGLQSHGLVAPGGGPAPALCRTAINRAYYAAFNKGVELLGSLGVALAQDADAHGDLRYRLRQSGNSLLARVSGELRTLYRFRALADYELESSEVDRAATARQMIATAARAMRSLEEFGELPEQRRAPAVDVMRQLGERPGRRWSG